MAHPRIAVGLGGGASPPTILTSGMLGVARALRLHSLWVTDHFLGFFPQQIWDSDFSWVAKSRSSPHEYFEYQVLLGHLARRAGRVRLAVGVTEPIRRHPVVLAQAFLTLSHLSRRPPILGIGAGERENTEPYGLDFTTPVARLEEALQIIRMCFSSRGPFDYQGRHFRLERALLDLPAGRGGVPEIWIAAHRPRMLRLTGVYGDGWYPSFPMTPDEYADKLSAIRAAAVGAGRDPESITPGFQIITVFGRTRQEARRLLDTRAIRFLALMVAGYVWRSRGAAHPFGESFGGIVDLVPQSFTRGELEDALAAVPSDFLAESMIWGTPDDVLAQIRQLAEAGLRHVVLAPASAMVSRRDAAFSIRAWLRVARRLQGGT